jgi:hypothetical protein
MAQCAGLATFRFRNRPMEDPLQVSTRLFVTIVMQEIDADHDTIPLKGLNASWLVQSVLREQAHQLLKLFVKRFLFFLQVLRERINPESCTEDGGGIFFGPGNFWGDEVEGSVSEGSEAEAADTFCLPEESKELLASTLTFAMDQLTSEEPAAYSAYVGVLRRVSCESCGEPMRYSFLSTKTARCQ